ncbi:MAG: nucleotidyl transferase [Rhodospirillaceae bacterium]|nr:nucleotidyl transferase [Rhodospirillaceae bacterium]
MNVVILAGGRGLRAYPFTEYLPKPMIPVCGKPIIVRVMNLYAKQGIKEFIISLGYRKEAIEDYFADRTTPWKVSLVDTGDESDTGGRIYNVRDRVSDTFMATYSDAVCDVPLDKLLEFHHSHDGLATITSVPLPSQYGTIDADENGRILAFREKPILREHWINAGFFVMDKAIFDHWKGDNLEREVLPNLQKEGLLYTYRHDGFFKSMDTHKDQLEMEELFHSAKFELFAA